jgi:hypothetical protein
VALLQVAAVLLETSLHQQVVQAAVDKVIAVALEMELQILVQVVAVGMPFILATVGQVLL